jgi:GDPmannose 4,6-dehydratase
MIGRALIIGSAGQDGRYLAEFLSKKGYWVAGADRADRSESSAALDAYWRCDLRNPLLISSAIDRSTPSEIYYLAAQNFSSEDKQLRTAPVADVLTVNLTGAAVTLSSITAEFPTCRFFYAGSCHVFGNAVAAPQNEETPHNPTTPYGISKAAGLRLCRYFRESHGVFAVGGILFNHESPLRRPPFVTARIAHAAALVSLGKGEKIAVHDTDAAVDWGAASDFVEAMWLALTHPTPDDYVIATGIPHTVAEFAHAAFNHIGARWEDWVVSGPSGSVRQSAPYVGDSTRIRRATGWEPRTSFRTLVETMVDAHTHNPDLEK